MGRVYHEGLRGVVEGLWYRLRSKCLTGESQV